MDKYPPIADHGLIGDLQTAALVTTDGAIDWYCCPRFDSPSVFASLLDLQRGGQFRIAPDSSDYVKSQIYLPESAILITRFMAEEGVGEVIDFMPIDHPEKATDRHHLVRLVRVVRGQMRFKLECQPRFDYGRKEHKLELAEHGAVFRSPDLTLTLHARSTANAEPIRLSRSQGDVFASFSLQMGQGAGVVLESASEVAPGAISAEDVRVMLEETTTFWRQWLERSTYRGRWREMVSRSAMTLKLMTYAPTGALVAAVTTGLPEGIGGERNWDYRFTWIRDASFSVYALLGLGYQEEAAAFMRWVRDRVDLRAARNGRNGAARPLKIMYRIDGSSDLREEILDNFEGYQGSRPVRIGNGAADQLQLDIYGEFMDSLFEGDKAGFHVGYEGWSSLRAVMDWLTKHWDQPEEGIWETRGGQKDFVYGRLMSWVAFDRMIRMAEHRGMPANIERYRTERDKIYQQIMEKGWNPKRRAFTQHYDTDVLDASVLMMPLVGFIGPQDPRWLSTLDAMRDELVSDSLVYRYNPSASPDGLRGHEGTFSIATFWLVDALARSGFLEEARYIFEKMETYANHVGLYAEQIGLTGEQLGNFPQAFTHLQLINAAMNLDYQLDHGSGVVDLAQLARRAATSS